MLRRRPLRRLFVHGLYLVLVVVAMGAAAQPRDVYTVSGIRVDETAADELTAKKQAIASGQRRALQKLFELITLRDDYDLLPEIDDALVQRVLNDFAVAGEKFGGGRYLAELTVRFKPEEVRRLLREQGIAFADTRSRPVLVLPVYQVAGSTLLWDEPNPWFDAWAKRPPPEGLLPIVVPTGDYADMTEISAEQAVRGDDERLQAIAAKYDALATLVVVARLQLDPRTGAPTIRVSMTRYGAGDTGRTLVRSFSGAPGTSVESLLSRAVDRLIIRAEEDWKRDNLQRFDGERKIAVLVPFGGFREWLTIRKRLASVTTVTRVVLVRLSTREATLELRFAGATDQLRLAMAQSDLDLSNGAPGGRYLLRLRRQR